MFKTFRLWKVHYSIGQQRRVRHSLMSSSGCWVAGSAGWPNRHFRHYSRDLRIKVCNNYTFNLVNQLIVKFIMKTSVLLFCMVAGSHHSTMEVCWPNIKSTYAYDESQWNWTCIIDFIFCISKQEVKLQTTSWNDWTHSVDLGRRSAALSVVVITMWLAWNQTKSTVSVSELRTSTESVNPWSLINLLLPSSPSLSQILQVKYKNVLLCASRHEQSLV